MQRVKETRSTYFRRTFAGGALALAALLTISACASPAKETPAAEPATAPAAAPTPEPVWPKGEKEGTLANPYSIGEEMTDGDWSLVIDSVNLDANAEIKAMDSIASKVAPDPGNTWVTFTATWKYNGATPEKGGTQFSVVNKNWDGTFGTDDEYGTTFNNVSTLPKGASTAPPAEKGFSVTDKVILQMPVEHANPSSMIVANFNAADYNQFLVKLK